MDGFDIALYISYAMVLLAVIGSIVLPLINALDNPKTLMKSGAGILGLIVLFGLSYLLSGNEVTGVYAQFNVDASGSQLVGALLTMMYFMIGIALIGIVYTEISKIVK